MRIILLHKFLDNSTKDFLFIFKAHTIFTPILEALETTETDAKLGTVRPEDAPQDPLFPVNLLTTPDELKLDPSLKVMKDIFNQISDLWYDYCVRMRSFVGDAIFKPFTKY